MWQCSDNPNAQPLTHAPELCDRNLSPQLLAGRGFSFVNVLPIGVEGAGHAIFFNPAPQHPGRRPDRLCFAQMSLRLAGGIVHHVHQAASRTPFFQPIVKTTIQLHQFAKVGFTLSALAMFLSFSLRYLPLPLTVRGNEITEAALAGDTPTATSARRTLRITTPYLRGEDVKALQQALAKNGLANSADGI
jgi:hypothetical protein